MLKKRYIPLYYAVLFGIAALIIWCLRPKETTVNPSVPKPFAELKEGEEFLVYIEWQTEKPNIRFISPSGKEYSAFTDRREDGIRSSTSEIGKSCYFGIENAETGEWKVLCNRGDVEITMENSFTGQ